MAEKKQHGGDWFDKIQAHNRNVALDRQARAAEETARQAKIEQLQKEQHRRRLEEIEEKRATDEAARLRLVQDEQEKKEIAKYENTKIYNLFRRLKEIEDASTPGQKYLLIWELKNEAETIDLEAVLDISYKDRFFETIDALKIALDKLYAECGKNATYFREYEVVMEKAKDEISSLSEIRSFENVVEALKIFPELFTPAFDAYKKRINVFSERASKAKSFFETLKLKSPESCRDRLKGAIASTYNIPISIFSEEDYDSLEILPIENENLALVKEAMMEVAIDASIPSEDLQPLFDFLAEQSSTTKIVIETYRREKALEKLVQVIARKKEQKEQKELNEMRAICKSIDSTKIIREFDIPNDDDVENPVVAKVCQKPLTNDNEIIFYRDHVCWLTDNKVSFSVSWDDLVHSWKRDFKRGGFLSFSKFREHNILDNRRVELFERLIAYKQSIIEQQKNAIISPCDDVANFDSTIKQQEKSVISSVVVSSFNEESSGNPTKKDSEKNNLPDDTMRLFPNVDDPHIFMNPNIPPKKLRNALESYAPGIAPADVLVLIDDTVFGGAKEGMIITKRKLFSKQILQSPIASELAAETKISLVRDRELHINGRKVHVFITPKKNSLPQLIEAVVKMCQS